MTRDNIIKMFREKGLRITTQRIAIYEYISSRKDHPTADQVYQALQKDYPMISLGTIYKTLNIFHELGIIQELGFPEGSIRYDPNTQFHINMVCKKCGKISDYESDKVSKIWATIKSDLNIEPEGQRVDIYYECDNCKNNS